MNTHALNCGNKRASGLFLNLNKYDCSIGSIATAELSLRVCTPPPLNRQHRLSFLMNLSRLDLVRLFLVLAKNTAQSVVLCFSTSQQTILQAPSSLSETKMQPRNKKPGSLGVTSPNSTCRHWLHFNVDCAELGCSQWNTLSIKRSTNALSVHH